ncbi:MAG TPA: alpha/beta hydrolase [Beijerinckiaceae bacterium]|nr:alpha/beta hydrolase [Beijerinckiaceae bacterium]
MPFLDVGDADIHYETFGKGTPFVFCTATATHSEVWKRFQVPEFSRDHTVILHDQRGTGQSKLRSKDVSTKRLADDISALLDHLGLEKAIVLGHSIGGRVAQVLTLNHSDKVGKLILASTGASFPSRGIPLGMCLELVEKGYEPYVAEHSRKVGFTPEFIAANREIVEEFLKVRLSNPPPLEIFLRFVIARQETDTSGRLKDIRVPTLVMVGEAEGKADASGISHMTSSEELARGIPGAKFVTLPGQGHYYPFVVPEMTHTAIRAFLAETSA